MTRPETSICAAEAVFRVVRGRWALSLIATIADQQPVHFLALSRSMRGISRKVLTEQLRFFQQAGVVKRLPDRERQEVSYELTARGKRLKAAIDGLNDLASDWDAL